MGRRWGQSSEGGERSLTLTASQVGESIGHEMPLRKAEEAAKRRCEAARWLREMDPSLGKIISEEPSEEEFCTALRNGLVLCNVLNLINPGAISKVVENPIVAVHSTDGAAQSAIQYFENMRNFLVAVHQMELLTFEASDIEEGGASVKVVDCILCLKGYHEWKSAGSIGTWRYGTIVKISPSTNKLAKGLPDNSSTNLEMSSQILEFLQLLMEVSVEELKQSGALGSTFNRFALNIMLKFFKEGGDSDECCLTDRLVEMVLEQSFSEFALLLSSHKDQAVVLLKKLMRGENGISCKSQFMDSLSSYLQENKYDLSPYLKLLYNNNEERIDCQQKQLEILKSAFSGMMGKWEEDLERPENCSEALNRNNASYQKLLKENRALYNQVQDLKGNIRVYCRVRPFLKDMNGDEISTVDHIGENGDIIISNPNKKGKDSRKIFCFNKVFGTDTSQADVFSDTQSLIRSVMDGYQVCIFAYGQTGSGKTYTMSGPDITAEESWGVNYRALNDLFSISNERTDVVSYSLTVQMIEIYNEQVRDLLVSDGSNKRLEVRNNSQLNGLNIPDASLVPVTCTGDVLELMKIGLGNRVVGATALNDRSSRSHSILTVHVHGTELTTGTNLRGCLHLVDLAGSERVDKSEATGDRLNEAKHINFSLSALGDVIAALSQKSSHVPYRNSKLTHVLQDALGGQAKTLMFVHINPEKDAFCETLSTLKFAERVASIELGAARVNKESGHIKKLKEEIARLKSALEDKESEISNLKSAARQVASEPSDTRPRSPLSSRSVRKTVNSATSKDDIRNLEVSSSSSVSKRRYYLSSSITDSNSDYKTPISGTDSQPDNASSRRLKAPTDTNTPIRISPSTANSMFSKHKPKPESCEKSKVSSNWGARKSCGAKENSTLGAPCTVIEAQGEFGMETELKGFRNSVSGNLRKTWFSKENGGSVNSRMDIEVSIKPRKMKSEMEAEAGNDLSCVLQGSMKGRRFRSPATRVSQTKEPRYLVREKEPLSDGKLENKVPCGERNAVLSDVRRSRSLPRGKMTAA